MPDEIVAVASLALLIFLVRLALDRTLFDSLANVLSIRKAARIVKFKENAFNTLYYTVSLIVGYVALIKTGWLDIPFFASGYDQEVLPSVSYEWASNWAIAYYIMSAAYYTQATFASVTIDGHKLDKWVMFFHHLLTLGLISLSAYQGGFRLGFFVILLHDVSDVFLYTAKCFKYAGSKWDQVLFVCFAVSFYVLRIIVFPFVIIGSCLLEWWRLHGFFMECNFWNIFCWDRALDGQVFSFEGEIHYVLFGVSFTYYGTMLFMLVVLMFVHCWWGSLIGHMIYQKVTTGHVENDVRSDDEEEGEDEKGKKDK